MKAATASASSPARADECTKPGCLRANSSLSITIIAAALLLTGCSSERGIPAIDFGPKTIEPAAQVSAECDAAAQQAVAAVEAIHDRENQVYDEVYADNNATEEETQRLLDLGVQVDGELRNAMAPTLTSCATASEWIAVAQRYPAFVESTGAEAITDTTLQSACTYAIPEESPVCADARAQGIEFERAEG